MAANQTIIKAAGQRDSSVPTDYSGYIQGLTHITTALVEKKKLLSKKQAEVNKLMEGAETDITPWGSMIKSYIDQSEDDVATKTSTVKKLKEGTLKLEENQSKLGTLLNPKGPGLSNSVDAITANWMYSYANGDFDQSFYIAQPVYDENNVQIGTDQIEFNMNMAPDMRPGKNFSPLVVGPEGMPIDMDEFENLLNVPQKGDEVSVTKLLREFPSSTGVKEYRDQSSPSDKTFNNIRDEYLTQIEEIFTYGAKNAQNERVSGENVMKSFMFDGSFMVDGEKQTFVKWYLNKPGLIPEELQEMYNETFRENFQEISGEDEELLLNMLAQDIMKYDPNIKEDLMKYINAKLEHNRLK